MVSILYTEDEISSIVKSIAEQINQQKRETPPVMICVLNGAFMFFTDLVKELGDCEIDFIRVKSYDGITQGDFQMTKFPDLPLYNRDVFIIDDIYDTGNTIDFIIKKLRINQPKSITPIVLFKRYSSDTPENLIFGNLIKDEAWLYGYGLDGENGLHRNLKEVRGAHIKAD